jgi:hypothetical protein
MKKEKKMKRKVYHAQSRNLQDGDIITAEEALYIENLEQLWDMLSDAVEGGRLTQADAPDDYRAYVHQMTKLVVLSNLARKSV